MSTVSLAESVRAGVWLSSSETMRRLSVNSDQLARLIRNGSLSVKSLPGLRKQILESDVERLLNQSVKLAK